MWLRFRLAGIGLALLGLGGCALVPGPAAADIVPQGDADRGAELLDGYGCDACHTIPGIRGSQAMVGPPLTDWPKRAFIAGTLPNTPPNLMRWIQAPQAIDPGTGMPDLGVTEADARDMSAYLYTLR